MFLFKRHESDIWRCSARQKEGSRIIVIRGEHPSVFKCAHEFAQRGYELCWQRWIKCGKVVFEIFQNSNKRNKHYFYLHVNNETGAIK